MPGRVSFWQLVARGVLSVLMGGLIGIPTLLFAIGLSWGGSDAAFWFVAALGLAVAIWVTSHVVAGPLRRASVRRASDLALAAAAALGVAVVAVGYVVVSIVGVIVGIGFIVLVSSEAIVVVVWALALQRVCDRNGGRPRSQPGDA